VIQNILASQPAYSSTVYSKYYCSSFFASVGLRVNFVTNFDLSVVLVILGIACIGKLVGAGVGSRMSGLNRNESYAIAFGMNARGSQEIVLGMLALQAKIIDERIFVGLVVMTMVTILITGPVMKFYLDKDLKLRKESGAQSEAQLIMLQDKPDAAAANE
jgi:Kef-type K+ transport system membrane component KefB